MATKTSPLIESTSNPLPARDGRRSLAPPQRARYAVGWTVGTLLCCAIGTSTASASPRGAASPRRATASRRAAPPRRAVPPAPRGSTEVLGRGTVAMRVESAPAQHLVTWRRLPWDPSNTWYRIDRAPVTGDDCASIPHEAWEEIAQSPTQSTGVRATGINPGRRYCYAVTAGSRHDLSKPVAHVEPSWVGPSSNTGGLIFQTCDPGQHCPHLQYITRVVPGDLNGDGVMDLVALASKTKQTGDFHVIAFVSGDGGWTRTEAASTRFGPDGTKNNRNSKLRRWMPLAVRDMDGDGRAEIFTRGRKAHGDGSVLLRMYRLEERTGSSRLTPADDAGDVTWPTHVDPRSVFVVADLEDTTGDGTGDPHLVIQQGYDDPHFLTHRVDRATGTLTRVSDCRAVTKGRSEVGSQGLLAADIDADGNDELLAGGLVLEAGARGARSLACTGSMSLKQKWRWTDDDGSDLYLTASVAVDAKPGRAGLEVFMTPKGGGRPAVLLDSRGKKLEEWKLNKDPENRGEWFKGWERGWCADVHSGVAGIECFSQQYWKRCVRRNNGRCVEERGNFSSRMFSARTGAEVTHRAWPGSWTKDERAQSWPQDWAAPVGKPELRQFCAGTLGSCGWYTGWVGDLVGDAREESVLYGGGGRIAIAMDTSAAPLTRSQARVTPLAFREYRQSIARTGVGYSVNYMPVPSTVPRTDITHALAPPRIDSIAATEASLRAGETATIVVRGGGFDEDLVLLSRFTDTPSEHFRVNSLVSSWSSDKVVLRAPIGRDTEPGPWKFQLRFDYGAGRSPWSPSGSASIQILPPPDLLGVQTPDAIDSGQDLVVRATVTPDSLQAGDFTVWARFAPFNETNEGFDLSAQLVTSPPQLDRGIVELVLPDYTAAPGVIEYQLRIGYGDGGFTPWVTDRFRVR